MTDEELAAISARVHDKPSEYEAIDKRGQPRGKFILRHMVDYPHSTGQYRNDALDLLRHAEQLREIARGVAEGSLAYTMNGYDENCLECLHCFATQSPDFDTRRAAREEEMQKTAPKEQLPYLWYKAAAQEFRHDGGCLVTKARKLLGME